MNNIDNQSDKVESVVTTAEQAPQETIIEQPKDTVIQTTNKLFDVISDELKISKSLEKFKDKDVNEIVKSYMNLENMIGKKVNDMSPDLVKQFLNVPKAPEEYIVADEFKENKLKDILFKVGVEANLSNDQMKKLTDELILKERSIKETQEKEIELQLAKEKQELQEEFGLALDNRLELIKTFMNKFIDQDTQEFIKNQGLLHNAKFIKFLDKVSNEILPKTIVAADYAGQKGFTPMEAKKEIDRKLGDKEFREAYFGARHPNHKNAVEEITQLWEYVNSNKSVR